jgi:hypothetical protein
MEEMRRFNAVHSFQKKRTVRPLTWLGTALCYFFAVMVVIKESEAVISTPW